MPIDWSAEPVGVVSDEELAHRLGVSFTRVRTTRRALAIPPVAYDRDGQPIDWRRVSLGERLDEMIAVRLGVSVGAVMRARQAAMHRRAGASRRRAAGAGSVDWDAQALKRLPDAEIARRVGMRADVVAAERRARGIDPCRPATFDWNEAALGEASDDEIAERLGISARRVARERRARRIPPVARDDAGEAIDWNRWRLDEIADSALAKVLGVPSSVVTRARIARGLSAARLETRPAYSGVTPATGDDGPPGASRANELAAARASDRRGRGALLMRHARA